MSNLNSRIIRNGENILQISEASRVLGVCESVCPATCETVHNLVVSEPDYDHPLARMDKEIRVLGVLIGQKLPPESDSKFLGCLPLGADIVAYFQTPRKLK